MSHISKCRLTLIERDVPHGLGALLGDLKSLKNLEVRLLLSWHSMLFHTTQGMSTIIVHYTIGVLHLAQSIII